MWEVAFKSWLEGINTNQCTHLTLTVGDGDFSIGPKNLKPVSTWRGHTGWVMALTVLPDGSVVSGGVDNTLRRWEAQTGRCLRTWKGHTGNVYALTVLPDGSVVSGSLDKTLRRWEAQTGRCLGTWEGHTDTVTALTVLPDGSVVSGSDDKTLRRWDAQSGRCLGTWKGHTDYVRALTVLPDGSVVSGSNDNTLRRWDAQTGRCLRTWKGHTGNVYALTVLPDGSVVSGSYDKTLRRWDAQSGRCLGAWKGHTNTVWALAMLPDGSLVSGSQDYTLRRWDAQTGRCLGTWYGHTGTVKALTVLPDGSVVSGSFDKTLCRWPKISHSLIMQQCIDIMESLRVNTSLTSLSLSMTQGTVLTVGFEHLLAMLKIHPVLDTVTLEHCGLDANGIEQVLMAIKDGVSHHQSTLKTLSLEGNPGLEASDVSYALGLGYFSGGGLVVDIPQGVQLLTQAAEKGHVLAASKLAWWYASGTGVNADVSLAAKWAEQGALEGEGICLWLMGLLYTTGIGAASDSEKAQEWFAKVRTQALSPLTQLLVLGCEHSVFRTQQDLTVYHLMALMGDVRWYTTLQALSHDERQYWGLDEDTVLAKNRQGLRASELARQQYGFIAEDKGMKALSEAALNNPLLQQYHQCATVLRQGEEEAQLAKVLRAQQQQQQVRLNYTQRFNALLDNVDRIRMAYSSATRALQQAYLPIIQQVWQVKQVFITLKNTLRTPALLAYANRWPEDFDPYSIVAPAVGLAQFQEEQATQWFSFSTLLQSPASAYIKQQQRTIRAYEKGYETAFRHIDACSALYTTGKSAFAQWLDAYTQYRTLWERSASEPVLQACLSHTPTLLLQSGKPPSVVDPIIPDGATLSPAKKLSYFLNGGMKIEGMVGAGTAPVFPINGVHYKRYPHAPGVEFMVSSLGNVLAGEGATPTVLLKVIGPDGIPYPYQASHTVQGRDLESLIRYYPEHMGNIRPDNFSAVTVLGMLTDPQDGKPDNYMMEFQVDKNTGDITEIEILGIDNDIAFADVVISKHVEGEKAGHYFINIKNVIYFFPQMHQPIDPTFRDTFLKREPEFILIEWLLGLQAKNTEYAALLEEGIFTPEEYSGDGSTSKRGLQLPIKVVPGTIRTLYRKLCQMNAILKEKPTITLWELLTQVEPEVAMHYGKVRAQHNHDTHGCDIMACIKALYEENISNGRDLMYFRAQLDRGFTHTMTDVVLRTAEEFGFEDNRTATLDNCVWQLLKVVDYDRFTGALAPVLYEQLQGLVAHYAPQYTLLNRALAHDAYRFVDWLWQERCVERTDIQEQCLSLKRVTLLHFFAAGRWEAGVIRLLENNVYPVDITDSRGYTPLHKAASVGDEVVATVLLEHGADVQARTTRGLQETPLAIAQRRAKASNRARRYASVIACLMEHGAVAQQTVQPPIIPNHQPIVEPSLPAVPHPVEQAPSPREQATPLLGMNEAQRLLQVPSNPASGVLPLIPGTAPQVMHPQLPHAPTHTFACVTGPDGLRQQGINSSALSVGLYQAVTETGGTGGDTAGTTMKTTAIKGKPHAPSHNTTDRWLGKSMPGAYNTVLATLLKEVVANRLYGFYGVPTPQMTVSVQPVLVPHHLKALLAQENNTPAWSLLGFAGPDVPHLLSRWLHRFTAYGTLPRFKATTAQAAHHCLSVSVANGENTRILPERGLGHILAVAQLLNDVDVVGGSGGNIGYYLRMDNTGTLMAVSANIDPGEAFQSPPIVGGWLRLVTREPDAWALEQQQHQGLVFIIHHTPSGSGARPSSHSWKDPSSSLSLPDNEEAGYILHAWCPTTQQVLREPLSDSPQGRQLQRAIERLPQRALGGGHIQDWAVEVAVAGWVTQLGGVSAFTVTRTLRLATAGELTHIAPTFDDLPQQTRQEFIHTVRLIIATPPATWEHTFAVTYQNTPLIHIMDNIPSYVAFLTQRQQGLAIAYAPELADTLTYPPQPPLPTPPPNLSLRDYHLWQGALSQGINGLEQQQGSAYIPLSGAPTPHGGDEQSQSLDALWEGFLCHPHYRVWRLLGGAGSGKSTLLNRWAAKLWERFQAPVENNAHLSTHALLSTAHRPWRTLHIPLSHYEGTTVGDCITHTLRTRYHWTLEEISAAQGERWLFLLDGYDEIPGKPAINLFDTNHLQQWPYSKVIITCRSDDPRVNETALFTPTVLTKGLEGEVNAHKTIKAYPLSLTNAASLFTTYIRPLAMAQIQTYFAQLTPPVDLPAGWLEHPRHGGLFSNPFVLRLGATVLSRLLANGAHQDTLTLSTVYETFLTHWFERAYGKHSEQAGHILPEHTQAAYTAFFHTLGLTLFHAQTSLIEPKEAAFAPFFEVQHHGARTACPLQPVGAGQYQFIHRSYGEYAAAGALIQALRHDTPFDDTLTAWAPVNIAPYPTIMGFLVEGIQAHSQQKALLTRLWDLLRYGQTTQPQYAASNALSVLNRLGEALMHRVNESFIHHDFQHLYAPGADIRNGCFTGSDWTGATLTGAQWHNAVLDQCIFTKATLTGAQWGQYPLIHTHKPTNALLYSPQGQHLIVGTGEQVIIQDLTNNTPILTLTGHTGRVSSLAMDPSGARLVSGSRDTTLRVWNMATGTCETLLQGHTGAVTAVAFLSRAQHPMPTSHEESLSNPPPPWVVSASEDGTLRVWDITQKRCIQVQHGHEGAINALAINPQGTLLATAGVDNTVRLWGIHQDRNTCTLEAQQVLTGHEGTVTAVTFSPDGITLASASHDKTVRLWDTGTTQCIRTLTGHGHWVSSVAFSPDGHTLSTGGWDTTVRQWDWKTGQCLATDTGHNDTVTGVAFHPQGTELASTGKDNTVRRWVVDTTAKDNQHTLSHTSTPSHHHHTVTDVALTATGNTVVSSSWDGTLQIWQGTQAPQGIKSISLPANTHQNAARINAVAIHPTNAHLVASAHGDNQWRLWDITTGACLLTPPGHDKPILAMAYAPDGHTLVTASRDNTLKHWDSTTGACLATLTGHTAGVTAIVPIPHSHHQWVSSSFDKTLRLWRIDKSEGHCIATFEGHSSGVVSVAVHPQGHRIATGSGDNTVKIWDIKTHICLATYQGHTDTVNAVAYSQDGSLLASASKDNTVRVWNAHTGACIQTLHYHRAPVKALLFTPGNGLITTGADSAMAWWRPQQKPHPTAKQSTWQLAGCTHPYLRVEGMVITGVQGLTAAAHTLLTQSGATGNPEPQVTVSGTNEEASIIEPPTVLPKKTPSPRPQNNICDALLDEPLLLKSNPPTSYTPGRFFTTPPHVNRSTQLAQQYSQSGDKAMGDNRLMEALNHYEEGVRCLTTLGTNVDWSDTQAQLYESLVGRITGVQALLEQKEKSFAQPQ